MPKESSLEAFILRKQTSHGDFLSASLNTESEWNFRKLDKRLVTVKSKAPSVGKVAVLDAQTNILFMVQVNPGVSATPIEQLEIGKEYLFNLKVETSKDLSGVKADAVSFFEALDIDQTTEDFIKAYWLYPTKVRFQLTEVEEP
ncbi:MAG: hypothetical protein ACM3UY_04000 [Methanocella sp.]|jgi:hypothetical protein